MEDSRRSSISSRSAVPVCLKVFAANASPRCKLAHIWIFNTIRPSESPRSGSACRLKVARLRINVGGRATIAMSDLRDLFEGLGYVGAKTLLQSGNVVFDGGRMTGAALNAAWKLRRQSALR